MDILRFLHSFTRWAVVIIAIAVILYMLVGLIQKKPYTKLGNTLMSAFGGLVGVQWILGIVFLVIGGFFSNRHAWEHAFVMTIALAVAHLYIRWKRRELADARRYSYNLLTVLGTLGVVFIGLTPLMRLYPDILFKLYTG